MYTSRIREQLSEQMEQQKAFAERKAKITNDRNLTAQGQKEPLARLERERKAQAETAWAAMLKTLQDMKSVEAAPLTADEAARLAVAGQIIGSLDPKAPEVDTALDAILRPFQGRIPAQRVLFLLCSAKVAFTSVQWVWRGRFMTRTSITTPLPIMYRTQ